MMDVTSDDILAYKSDLTNEIKLRHAECQGFRANVPKLDLRLRVKPLAGQANNRALAETPMPNALTDTEHLTAYGDAR